MHGEQQGEYAFPYQVHIPTVICSRAKEDLTEVSITGKKTGFSPVYLEQMR